MNSKLLQQDDDADEALARRMNSLRNGHAPKLHTHKLATLDMDGDSRGKPWASAYERVLGAMRENRSALVGLTGTRGVGKTQLAVKLMNHFCERGYDALYVRAYELFTRFKSAYSNDRNAPREQDVIWQHVTPSLLVIDELQVRTESDWENTTLTTLLDMRYSEERRTLIISNLTAEAFGASVGASVVSRMNETGFLLQCEWPSFRK